MATDTHAGPSERQPFAPTQLYVSRAPRDTAERYVNVSATPTGRVPADGIPQLGALGVRFAFDAAGIRRIFMVAPARLVPAIRAIPWLTDIDTSSATAHPMTDRPHQRTSWTRLPLTWDRSEMALTPEGPDWSTSDIGADTVWQRASAGEGVRIAIIDDGIDCYSHPDLQANSKVVAWYDFVMNSAGHACSPGSANWHGTSVASVAAASRDGQGALGVAYGADLVSLDWCYESPGLPCDGHINYLYSAIYAAVDAYGAKVINLSVGTYNPVSADAQAVFDYAFQHGVSVVVAAGQNQNAPGGPVQSLAKLNHAIVVGSYDMAHQFKADYSFGPEIDIAAPFIAKAIMPGGVDYFQGTSASTPMVTATVALLLKAGFLTKPELLEQRLKESARPYPPQVNGASYSFGMLSANQAVVLPPQVQITSPSSAITHTGRTSFSSTVIGGLGPFKIVYTFKASNSPTTTTVTSGTVAPYTVTYSIPSGAQWVTLTATAYEQVYLRAGGVLQQEFTVCDTGANAAGREVTPNMPGGCGSEPPPEL